MKVKMSKKKVIENCSKKGSCDSEDSDAENACEEVE